MMDFYRLKHTIGMYLALTATKRAEYIKNHNIFYHMGDKCMTMFRKIPLYPELISFGNNVWIASNVSFVTHDVIHNMINNKSGRQIFGENLGCIKLEDNIFIGANSTVLFNVHIASNTIVGAGSLVNKDIRHGGVYAGTPVRYICSLEEYCKKRDLYGKIVIEKKRGRLSDNTLKACWERFESFD